jgi:hypothetical protein
LARGRILRASGNVISPAAFDTRRRFLCQEYAAGTYLKASPPVADPNMPEGMPPNPMADPAQMELMMDGMKKNLVMMVPQMMCVPR